MVPCLEFVSNRFFKASFDVAAELQRVRTAAVVSYTSRGIGWGRHFGIVGDLK